MCVSRRLDAVLEPTKKLVLDARCSMLRASPNNARRSLKQRNKPAATPRNSCFAISSHVAIGNSSNPISRFTSKDFLRTFRKFSTTSNSAISSPRCPRQTRLEHQSKNCLIPEIKLSPQPMLNSDGSLKYLVMANHAMGLVFEELVRKSNLVADLVFLPIADKVESGSYLLYDGACGTGGMLTVAEERLQAIAQSREKKVITHLYGQEINPETYAVCKADTLLKGEGENAEHMVGGAEWSTLSHDAYPPSHPLTPPSHSPPRSSPAVPESAPGTGARPAAAASAAPRQCRRCCRGGRRCTRRSCGRGR